MKYPRLRKIEEYIATRDFVSWEELCSVLGKSKNTVRRDVADLARDGLLEKVYGGVRPRRSPDILHNFTERTVKAPDEKGVIGTLAAGFIHDRDVIYLDSGTTTLNILTHITQRVGLTILTNNLHAIYYLIDYPNLDVISLGGELNRDTRSFGSNHCSLDKLESLNINKAFMAATGVSIENGVTNTIGELAIKQKIVERCDQCYLLADSSKFDRSALLTYADITAFQYVITNQPPPARYIEYFQRNNIKLITESTPE